MLALAAGVPGLSRGGPPPAPAPRPHPPAATNRSAPAAPAPTQPWAIVPPTPVPMPQQTPKPVQVPPPPAQAAPAQPVAPVTATPSPGAPTKPAPVAPAPATPTPTAPTTPAPANPAPVAPSPNQPSPPAPSTPAPATPAPERLHEYVDEEGEEDQTPAVLVADAPWSYTGDNGPTHWGKWFPDCRRGKEQAPVQLFGFKNALDLKLEFNYAKAEVTLANDGHALKATYAEPGKGGTISLNGKVYELVEFHFHTPGEHTLRGEIFGMEAHLLHKAKDDGSLAMVAVLITDEQLNDHEGFAPLLPVPKTETRKVEIDPDMMLPPYRSFFKYAGSLTTPPCTEGITWLVLSNTVRVSKEQLRAIRLLYPEGNARPVSKYNPMPNLGNSQSWE